MPIAAIMIKQNAKEQQSSKQKTCDCFGRKKSVAKASHSVADVTHGCTIRPLIGAGEHRPYSTYLSDDIPSIAVLYRRVLAGIGDDRPNSLSALRGSWVSIGPLRYFITSDLLHFRRICPVHCGRNESAAVVSHSNSSHGRRRRIGLRGYRRGRDPFCKHRLPGAVHSVRRRSA